MFKRTENYSYIVVSYMRAHTLILLLRPTYVETYVKTYVET